MSGPAENTLKIGDFVSLKVLLYNSFLSLEGILVEDVFATDTMESFEDHIFQIYIQMQYSASNEYEEFKAHFEGNIGDVEDESTLKHIQALKRGKENEGLLNDTFMASKAGNEISFGDVIQFRHKKSGKFLTVIPSELAKEERENIRVGLSQDGNSNSWIKILPRYKIDRIGSAIASNTEVLLKVLERSTEYIHCCDKPSIDGTHEINSAMENGTAFRISVYHRIHDICTEKFLLSGQLVTINDPETKSYLTILDTAPVIDLPSTKHLERQKQGNYALTEMEENSYSHLEESETVADESLSEESITSVAEYLEEHGEVILLPSRTDNFNTNALWILETPSIVNAGIIGWKSDKLLVRHLNTGKYLAIRTVEKNLGLFEDSASQTKQGKAEAGGDLHAMINAMKRHGKNTKNIFTLVNASELSGANHFGFPTTLFAIHEVHSGGNLQLENGKAIQLSSFNNKTFMGRCEYDDRRRCYACKCVKSRSKSSSLVIKRFNSVVVDTSNSPTEDVEAGEAGEGIGSSDTDLRKYANLILSKGCEDVHMGLSCKKTISNCLDVVTIPTSQYEINNMHTIFPSETTQGAADVFNVFKETIESITMYINGFKIPVDEDAVLSRMKPDENARVERQNMFREQGTLESLLRLLSKLIPVSIMSTSSSTSGIYYEDTTGVLAIGKTVISVCLKLLLRSIAGHPENQMYVADHLAILLAHVASDMMAAHCISEMLSINLELQELKISPKEINIFVDRLRESDMNAMFLSLLKACSSCKGRGNMKNQNVVANIVFNNKENDIIFALSCNYKKVNPVDWSSSPSFNLYAPNSLKKLDIVSNGMGENSNPPLISVGSGSVGSVGVSDGPNNIYCVNLVSKGIPSISVQWSWPSNKEYRPMSLFGNAQTDINEMFRAVIVPRAGTGDDDRKRSSSDAGDSSGSTAMNMLRSMRSTSAKELDASAVQNSKAAANKPGNPKTNLAMKVQVSEFLIAQLFLAAELCLDRNYSVIAMIEKRYPLDMLISIIKCTTSHLLRGAAARLMLTLHIDRHPQMSVTLPRLTRTYSQVEALSKSPGGIGSKTMPLLDVEMKNPNGFVLVQLLISDNLRKIKGKAYGNYSIYIVELLQKMVEFNFYGTSEKLRDVIDPVFDALNRRCVDYEASDVSSSLIQRRQSVRASFKGSRKMSLSQRMKDQEDSSAGNNSKDASGNASNSKSGLLADANASMDEDNSRVMTMDIIDPNCWQIRIFEKLESIEFVGFILVLVVISTAVALYQFLTDKGNSLGFELFGYALTAIFTFEYSMRGYCFHYINGEFWVWYSNWLNVIDFVVISLDFVIYATGPLLGQAKGFTKALRLLRLARLVRLAKAARMIEAVASSVGIKIYKDWVEPERYIKTSENDLKTMVKLSQVLFAVQKYVDDRNLTLMLDSFHDWYADHTSKSPADLFHHVSNVAATELRVSSDSYDDILLDLLLYHDFDLTQSVLDILMSHHASKATLLTNMSKVQLLMNSQRENQFKKIENMILNLRRHADTQDLWTKLASEEHKQINEDTMNYLNELKNACRKRRKVLYFEEDYEPETTVQDMLRNLGCFDICMNMMKMVPNLDNNTGEPTRNLRVLLTKCNELLYWFLRHNPVNQALAYEYLKFFVNSVDYRIDAHKVIRGLFEENLYLMKLCPKVYISEFVSKILNNGKFPEYLSLLASVTAATEDSVLANQYEIVRLLSSPENAKKITMYFCSPEHPEYAKKSKLMSLYLNKRDVGVEEVAPDLAYHLELMKVLTGCTVGRKNITTVEAKVQSLFHFVDVVEGIMDPQVLLLAKVRLALFFYNAMIDVEMKLPSLKDAACVWRLLDSFQDVFLLAKDDLRQIEKNGWDAPSSIRQKVEYMMVCVMIVDGYFTIYYDTSIYRQDILPTHVKRVHITENQGKFIMTSLFNKLKVLYEMQSPLLSRDHQQYLYSALVALNNCAFDKYVSEVENIHEYRGFYENNMKTSERRYENRFEEFVDSITSSATVNSAVDDEIQVFISKMEKLPLMKDNHEADVRYEAVMSKLVKHVVSCIKVVAHGDELSKEMDTKSTMTSSWILKIFTQMILNRWGMEMDERDEDGGEEEDDAVADLMDTFNTIEVMPMVLQLISKGIDPNLQLEAIRLGTAMLLKEGGAQTIQRCAYGYLSNPGSELFFEQARHTIQQLIAWHQITGIVEIGEDDEPELPKGITLLRFLQLLCEGHFKPNQDILREQPKCSCSINLLDDMVMYLSALDKLPCRTSTDAAIKCSDLILEVIQGPCENNQDYFALNTPLIETLNRNLRAQVTNDCIHEEQVGLKKTTIDIFQALLEGQGNKKAVYERVLSVIHIDVVHMMSDPGKVEEAGFDASPFDALDAEDEEDEIVEDEEMRKEREKMEAEAKEAIELSEEEAELQTESLVLLQMLCNYRPAMRQELGLTENVAESGEGEATKDQRVASIELIWRGELQRRFFRIPLCCRYLAKSTKDNFVATVDRSSLENKLLALVEESKEMYREIQHQKRIVEWGLNYVFSKTMQDRLTWTSFYTILLINVLMMSTFTTKVLTCPGGRRLEETEAAEGSSWDFGGISLTNIVQYFMALMFSFSGYYSTQTSTSGYASPVGTIPSVVTAPFESFHRSLKATIQDSSEYLEINLDRVIALTGVDNACSYIAVDTGAVIAIEVLRYTLLLFSACTLTMVVAVRVPVRRDRYIDEGYSNFMALVYAMSDFESLYYVGYLFLVIFTTQSPIIYGFLLLDIIMKDATTRDVVNSLWFPRKQLLATFLLTYILIYIFSVATFLFYTDIENWNFTEQLNLWKLYKLFVIYAPDGNTGGILENDISHRSIVDLILFFLIFVMLEMTKGIVIDAFSTLREEKAERLKDTTGTCFICGIDKVTFERQIDRTAFDIHIKNHHFLWNYFYFIIYLWEQDKDDDDGLEHDIRHAIENNDISWFPMNKAMQLQHIVSGDTSDSVESRFYEGLNGMEQDFHGTVSDFASYMNKSIDRVTRIIEATHALTAPRKGRSSHASSHHHAHHGSHHHGSKINSASKPEDSMGGAVAKKQKKKRKKGARQPFVPFPGFLETEQYIEIRLLNIIGLQLLESQYSKLICRVSSPAYQYHGRCTDYIVKEHVNLEECSDENSIASNASVGDNNEVEEGATIYMKNDVEVRFDRRHMILHVGEIDDEFLENACEVSIQLILAPDSKFPKLVGQVTFDLVKLIKSVQAGTLPFFQVDGSEPARNADLPRVKESEYFASGDCIKLINAAKENELDLPPFPLPSDYRLLRGAQPMQIEFKQRASCHTHVKSECQLVFDFVNHSHYSGTFPSHDNK